jgi:multidrug efflux pump subunit AcrA (membrane-fusion protein)
MVVMNRTKYPGRRASTLYVLVALGLLSAIITACGSSGSSGTAGDATPTPLPTPIVLEKPTYTVELGTVVETLEFTGRASPMQEQELFFETGGNVSQVNVARGDWVKAGDVLAELKVDDLQKQLAQKQINLETSRLKLEQAQIDAVENITTTQTKLEDAQASLKTAKLTSSNDLASARASVASAETSLENARLNLTIVQNSDTVMKNPRDREDEYNWYQVNYAEMQKKYEGGKISKERLDLEYNNLMEAKEKYETAKVQADLALRQAQSQITQAEESLRQAKAKLSELLAAGTVADAQAALEQAQKDHEQAIVDADPNSYNLRLLVLDLDQARLDIQDLEDQIASAQLAAPFDGQVLSLNVKAGDSVAAYDAVGVVADPNKLEITAELGSENLSQMALEQQARITLRNRPGETFDGIVRQLPYPYGGTTIDTGDDTATHIQITSDVALTVGELATVSIILQQKEGVLWLPPAAIRTYQGRNFCVVQNADGTQKRVDVLLGITTDERVEIVSGLEQGQVIVGE